MNIHYIQHVPFENLGTIEEWIKSKNYNITSSLLFKNDSLPPVFSFDALVIMGGPMNIYEYDKYLWLKEEKLFIEEAIKNNKKILGICLGAQLIADVLGAKIYKNEFSEIGWFDVSLTPYAKSLNIFNDFPDTFVAFHWHGDTFNLPSGSVRVATNPVTENQAFLYKNNVLGLQFHLETNESSLNNLIKYSSDDIKNEKYIQSADEMRDKQQFSYIKNLMFYLLDKFLE